MIDSVLKSAFFDVLDRVQVYCLCAGLNKENNANVRNINVLQHELVEVYRSYSIYDSKGLTDKINRVNDMLDALIKEGNSSLKRDILSLLNDKDSYNEADEMTVEMHTSLRRILEKQTEILSRLETLENRHDSTDETSYKRSDKRVTAFIVQPDPDAISSEDVNQILKLDPKLRKIITDERFTITSRILYFYNNIPIGWKLPSKAINIALNIDQKKEGYTKEYMRKLYNRGHLKKEKIQNSNYYYIDEQHRVKLIKSPNTTHNESPILDIFKNSEKGTKFISAEISEAMGAISEGEQRTIREYLLVLTNKGILNRTRSGGTGKPYMYSLKDEYRDSEEEEVILENT
jgi:DNA-binding transcriptional ArsR family regulator